MHLNVDFNKYFVLLLKLLIMYLEKINKKKPKVFRRNLGIVGTFDWSNNVNLEEIEDV